MRAIGELFRRDASKSLVFERYMGTGSLPHASLTVGNSGGLRDYS